MGAFEDTREAISAQVEDDLLNRLWGRMSCLMVANLNLLLLLNSVSRGTLATPYFSPDFVTFVAQILSPLL
jgi:hypothetical protein